MKISVPEAISSSLRKDKSRWGPDLENEVGGEAIRSVIQWFLPTFLSICELVHCLAKKCIFSSTNEALFLWFLFTVGPIMHSKIVAVDCFSFFQIVDEQYATGIPKNRSHNLSSQLLCLCSLWCSSTGSDPLFCLLFRFWHVVVDPCFINGH